MDVWSWSYDHLLGHSVTRSLGRLIALFVLSLHIYIYIYVYMCVCIYIYIYICTYTIYIPMTLYSTDHLQLHSIQQRSTGATCSDNTLVTARPRTTIFLQPHPGSCRVMKDNTCSCINSRWHYGATIPCIWKLYLPNTKVCQQTLRLPAQELQPLRALEPLIREVLRAFGV